MDREIITKQEAQNLYDECLEYPELIDGLDKYEAKKLLNIAKEEWRSYQSEIHNDIMANPPEEYDYPEEYLPNKLGKYWAKSINYGEPWDHYKMREQFQERLSKIGKDEKKSNKEKSDTENLIESFAKYFGESTQYSEAAIKSYITEWHHRKGLSSQRATAKKAAKKKCKELNSIHDGTLKNWEDKWEEFYSTRTGN